MLSAMPFKSRLASMLALATLSPAAFAAAPAKVDFSHQIVPILREHCAECHTGDKKKGGFSLNDRASLLAGGESGKAIVLGNAAKSGLIEAITTKDPDKQMPPKGTRLSPEKVKLLRDWIDAGAAWEEGFAFKKPAYEPPLKPRRPTLPPIVAGRSNPIDRILDADLAKRKAASPKLVDDATFARRVHLDLVGLLPEPEALEKFLADKSTDKRAALVRSLLANDTAYAEHWLTFWNDLLRNDYSGTGFITGGRKQITKWLYRALVENKPYDQLARELIAYTPDSEGFAAGIKWRGDVSAGATTEIQFAQSVGQSFLGINLKCASCHDSFIDRWKLEEAYGLAAIYATSKMEIHRCDKPVGKTAQASWLFPELGQVDAKAAQPERLKQLAALMTHPENGRFTRTIVNRLWHRLMGRGIVHPTDAMQSEPWNHDLLDFLASHLAENKFDLKQTLALIATSAAYQSHAQVLGKDADEHGYTYAGPRAKRLTAEQFVDTVWQITGTAPTRFDAQVVRGKPSEEAVAAMTLSAKWIWAHADAGNAKAGETFTARKKFTLKSAPVRAGAVATADNEFKLYVNGALAASGDNWENPEAIALETKLKVGANDFVLVAKNGGAAPNPAGVIFEARFKFADGTTETIASDTTWEVLKSPPDAKGKFKSEPATAAGNAVAVANSSLWNVKVGKQLATQLAQAATSALPMVRASLLKNDFFMRALGRPSREQIVSVRPADLNTLEAIDLNNGQTLATRLEQGAARLLAKPWPSSDALTQWLYQFALARVPTPAELSLAREVLGEKPTSQGVQDLLWAVLMLPEFQLVR
jgi:mono/diheme cytochrome c family protein